MEINYTIQEISVKIVYYGPGLSGKTTNIEVIHAKTPQNNRGNLTAIATEQDRTLFFDYMPLDIGKIGNFKVRLRLFTVPGQVYYNNTRKLVLRCVDGVVFVADSQEHKIQENLESINNLRENLLEQGEHLEDLPLLFQFNKRDLPNVTPMGEMAAILNQGLNAPYYPAVAVKGDGVFQCLKEIANMTMSKVESSLKRKKAKKVPKGPVPPTARLKAQTREEEEKEEEEEEIQVQKESTVEAKVPAVEAKVPAQIKEPVKIKLTPLGVPKVAGSEFKDLTRPPEHPAHTPPRGTPSLAAVAEEERKSEQPKKLQPVSFVGKFPPQPIGQTIRKPSISKDALFKGSLFKSGPSKASVSDPGAQNPARTPPGSITPISTPVLKSEEKKETTEP